MEERWYKIRSIDTPKQKLTFRPKFGIKFNIQTKKKSIDMEVYLNSI